MKRKLFIAGATFVLVAAAVTAIAANRQPNKPTLLEQNIEALGANGPGGGSEGKRGCYNSITIKEGVQTFYCGTCTFIKGEPTFFSGTGTC